MSSLLVFNASNRIAQGVVKRLYTAGHFERIVCADIYPNYYAVQRFLNFKQELGTSSSTKITDVKATERSDLVRAVDSCTHLLYVTHDYYSLTPSKLNLIKTIAELAKKSKNVRKLVALTPVEHDHFGEANPAQAARTSEKEAAATYPNWVHLKTDLTFGPDSTLAHSILTRLVNGSGLASVPTGGPAARPIHTDDVAAVTEAALRDDSHQGKAYLLQGNDSVTLGEYVNILQGHAGSTTSTSFLENIISPAGSNYLAQSLYDPAYANLVRLLKGYTSVPKEGFDGIEGLGLSLKGIRATYPERGINQANYREDDSGFERLVKNFIY